MVKEKKQTYLNDLGGKTDQHGLDDNIDYDFVELVAASDYKIYSRAFNAYNNYLHVAKKNIYYEAFQLNLIF